MPPLTLRDPETYDQWVERARSSADAQEIEAFRRDSASDVFDAGLLQEHTVLLQRAREKRRAAELTKLLQEALYRHLGELADARLYEQTPLGTKYVVERFYPECQDGADCGGHAGNRYAALLQAVSERSAVASSRWYTGRCSFVA